MNKANRIAGFLEGRLIEGILGGTPGAPIGHGPLALTQGKVRRGRITLPGLQYPPLAPGSRQGARDAGAAAPKIAALKPIGLVRARRKKVK